MFRNPRCAVFCLLLVFCATTVWAQSGTEENFNLSRVAQDTTRQVQEQLEVPEYEPALEGGKLEIAMTLGFLDLQTNLLAHDQIIYKYNDEATYWGDVKLQGKSAFNPILRIGYNLSSWFGMEANFGLTTSEYSSEITNRHRRINEEGAPVDPEEPPLSEFDGERRSGITLSAGLSGLLYPLNTGGGEGRWHPYIIGGISRFWMNLNSNYTDDPSQSWMVSGGLGLRFITDSLISVRFEILYNITTLQFTPAEYFDTLNDGTLEIPIIEFIENQDGTITEQRVTEYASQDLNAMSWALGFVASF